MFITFEGVEGCGKSTQSKLLKRRLESLAVPVLLTHEPGVTAIGKRINRLLKWTDNIAISPLAELLLFNTSRAQLVEEVIRPELEKSTLVICDRYADSTTAYQGYGRDLNLDMVLAANDIGTQGLVPDLTILLDMPVEEGMTRKVGDKPDRFETESMNFHRRVREGYLTLAEAEPQRWLVIDGMQDKGTIAGIIWQKVSRILSDEE
ncbi:MAG: dTMP kinase [Dehalococcoidales bacterium]|nr:dTMP kinase [Dehalococcoidales bacterium]